MSSQTINPANNKLLKSWPEHSESQVEQALATADALYHSNWSKVLFSPACRC